MCYGHLDYFQRPPLRGRPNTTPGDHGTLNAHNRWFLLFYHVWGPVWIEIHWISIWLRAWYIWLYTTLEDPWPHDMILEVSWDGLWTLSFGLSQFHGHSSWLMCEVALSTRRHILGSTICAWTDLYLEKCVRHLLSNYKRFLCIWIHLKVLFLLPDTMIQGGE